MKMISRNIYIYIYKADKINFYFPDKLKRHNILVQIIVFLDFWLLISVSNHLNL